MVARLTFFAAIALAAALHAEPPVVDSLEVLRRGNFVAVVGEGPRAGAEQLFEAAMGPPERDDDMWFITVWGKAGHGPSSDLVNAFQKSPHLAPFVATPSDTKKAWAHFNFYRVGDKTQEWRQRDFKVAADAELPIVVIQPPRNGRFGSARRVIDRIEAADCADAEKLRVRITNSVFLWCKKVAADGGAVRAESADGASQITADPPFATPPALPAFNPQLPKFPPLTIEVQPKVLTLEEIEEAAGEGADAAFILAQHKEKPTSKKEVRLAWLVHQAEAKAKPTPAQSPPPPDPPKLEPPADKSVLVPSETKPVPTEPSPAAETPANPTHPSAAEPPVEIRILWSRAECGIVCAALGLLSLIAFTIHRARPARLLASGLLETRSELLPRSSTTGPHSPAASPASSG